MPLHERTLHLNPDLFANEALCFLNVRSRKLLYDNGAGPEGVTALARSPHFRAVRDLRLGGNRPDAAALAALAEGSAFPSLTRLRLSSGRLERVPLPLRRRIRERVSKLFEVGSGGALAPSG